MVVVFIVVTVVTLILVVTVVTVVIVVIIAVVIIVIVVVVTIVGLGFVVVGVVAEDSVAANIVDLAFAVAVPSMLSLSLRSRCLVHCVFKFSVVRVVDD